MSDEFELLIVGGGPAGLSAARAYRDARGQGAVAIVSDEHRIPYNRPPLTKELLRGEANEDELPIESEAWLQEHGISLVSGRAVGLSTAGRVVALSGGRELRYRSCLLATGAEPTRLPVPGADHPAVRVIRSLDHVRELTRRLQDGGSVVVIGSGFIGCEIAASLKRRGHRVSLLSDEPLPNAGTPRSRGGRANSPLARRGRCRRPAWSRGRGDCDPRRPARGSSRPGARGGRRRRDGDGRRAPRRAGSK